MKLFLTMAIAAILTFAPEAQAQQVKEKPSPEAFSVLSDTVENGVRTIVATPSKLVCSKKIEIQIDTENQTIKDLKYEGGCPGNLNALCTLIKGMKVDEVLVKLDGNDCGKRGSSCMDQLCRIIRHCLQK